MSLPTRKLQHAPEKKTGVRPRKTGDPRVAEINRYSTGDADRIKPPPSPRVTALSACADTLFQCSQNRSDERMLIPSLVGSKVRRLRYA